MSNLIEVTVPDIGDFKSIPVIELLVSAGDSVNAEDALVTLESDKATMDVPAPVAGVVKEIKVKLGDKVSQGSLVLMLEAAGSTDTKPVAALAAAAPTRPTPPVPPSPPSTTSAALTSPALAQTAPAPIQTNAQPGASHASPSVRKFARELGVDLSRVNGSGAKNRVLHEDVQAYVKTELSRAHDGGSGDGLGFDLPPMPHVDFAKFGAVEVKALSRIRKLSGKFLHRNWVSIPHVTQHDEADVTELEAFRKSQTEEAKRAGVKFTMLGFLMKAVAVSLKQFPEFSSSLSTNGESLTLKHYCHIGVAVDTPSGLVVPVIRDVDKKGLLELAKELGAVSERMRTGKIAPADVQGGCFSISSLGGIGGTLFTPIINAPEVAILGVGKSVMKPVWNGKEFTPRLMLPLSLSYDHRVIDGAQGARFIAFLSSVLSDIRRLAL